MKIGLINVCLVYKISHRVFSIKLVILLVVVDHEYMQNELTVITAENYGEIHCTAFLQ